MGGSSKQTRRQVGLRIQKDKRSVPIDELWLHTMLAAIGETLEEDDDGKSWV
jgi:hypothetical protein